MLNWSTFAIACPTICVFRAHIKAQMPRIRRACADCSCARIMKSRRGQRPTRAGRRSLGKQRPYNLGKALKETRRPAVKSGRTDAPDTKTNSLAEAPVQNRKDVDQENLPLRPRDRGPASRPNCHRTTKSKAVVTCRARLHRMGNYA